MNRKMLIASAAILTISTTAMAADLPSRRAPPVFVPPPVFSWAGFYVGGQIGYAFGQDNTTTTIQPAVLGGPAAAVVVFPGAVVPGTAKPSGVIGGGHVGYNFVLPGFAGFGSGLILGIEGSVDGTDYSQTTTFGAGNAFFVPAGSTASIRSDIQGSVRGRLGIAVDRALFYATGGAAFADFKTTYNNVGIGFDSFSRSRVGYTVGGGVEYAITTNWSLRAEYRYSDFGTFTDALVASSLIPGTTVRHRETENTVQLGFSYRFDTPLAPVVARY